MVGDSPLADYAPIPQNAPTMGAGRYAFAAKLALGGMAAVYRIWDHKLRVWRAIKVLLPDAKDHVRARFEAEAKMMARIDHPHVIRIYDVGHSDLLPYIVMELADGGTLNSWIDENGPMPPALAMRVVLEVALGLSAAHAIGLVHRDVKPHNVLVTSDGRCKVTDFGIAHWTLEGETAHTQTGMSMGTLGYMAPEQRNDARKVDIRADVYSLGALLFKLVVGKVLTDLFLVEHEPDLLEGVPQPLHEVIVRACYRDRSRRYSDIDTMRRVLAEILPLLPPDPPDTPPLAQPMVSETDDYNEISTLLDSMRRASRAGQPRSYTMSRPPPISRSQRSFVPEPAPLSVRSLPPKSLPPKSLPPTPSRIAYNNPNPTPSLAPEPHEIDLEGTNPSLQPLKSESAPRPWIAGLALASASLWGMVAALALVGTVDVNRHADANARAMATLIDVTRQEQTLLTDLVRYGVAPERVLQINALYDVALRAEDPYTQLHTTLAYVSAIDDEARQVLATVPPSDLVVVRARNIARARVMYTRTHEAWFSSTSMPHGRLATMLHLAPIPPM